MIPGCFVFKINTSIHGISARNSVKREAKVMDFKTEYKPMVDLLSKEGITFMSMVCNGMMPLPDYLNCWCEDGEAVSEFEITRVDNKKVNVRLFIENENF